MILDQFGVFDLIFMLILLHQEDFLQFVYVLEFRTIIQIKSKPLNTNATRRCLADVLAERQDLLLLTVMRSKLS